MTEEKLQPKPRRNQRAPQGSECPLFLFVSWAVTPGNAMLNEAARIEAFSCLPNEF